MIVRAAAPTDHDAIASLVTDAFTRAFGRSNEAALIAALRRDGDVAAELVAETANGLVGHIVFSKLLIEREETALSAVALAPVSARIDLQNQGIGAALIRAGLRVCEDGGAAAAFVLGHPNYYPRFGFSAEAAALFDAPFKGAHFMALLWSPDARAGGKLRYAAAFGA